jgi:cyclohexyl-isocyanide hydratase
VAESSRLDVGILVFEGADSLDVFGPMRVLSGLNELRGYMEVPDVVVHLVAASMEPVHLAHGPAITPDSTFAECPPLDVLLVVGGSSGSTTVGRRVQQRNPDVLAFVRDRARDARVTASVCTGAFILAEAGLLAGRRANTHWRWREELRELMAGRNEPIEVVAERVVWDGDVVTAGGVTSGIDLGLAIVERFAGSDARNALEAMVERETV